MFDRSPNGLGIGVAAAILGTACTFLIAHLIYRYGLPVLQKYSYHHDWVVGKVFAAQLACNVTVFAELCSVTSYFEAQKPTYCKSPI